MTQRDKDEAYRNKITNSRAYEDQIHKKLEQEMRRKQQKNQEAIRGLRKTGEEHVSQGKNLQKEGEEHQKQGRELTALGRKEVSLGREKVQYGKKIIADTADEEIGFLYESDKKEFIEAIAAVIKRAIGKGDFEVCLTFPTEYDIEKNPALYPKNCEGNSANMVGIYYKEKDAESINKMIISYNSKWKEKGIPLKVRLQRAFSTEKIGKTEYESFEKVPETEKTEILEVSFK